MQKNINNMRLKRYLMITFLITWICWWSDALLVRITSLSESDVIPMILFTVGGFGPTLAACLCLDGKFTWKRLGRFLTGYKKNGILYLLLFAIIEILTFVFSSGKLLDFFQITSMPAEAIIFFMFIQAVILYGGNEELGWRGIMQPIMQNKLPYPLATLVVGIVWVFWHIPLWFIQGNSHQNMSFISFAVLGILLSYWLSAIYNATGSIIFCMIIHGLTNTLMGIFIISFNAIYIARLIILTSLAVLVSMVKIKHESNNHAFIFK